MSEEYCNAQLCWVQEEHKNMGAWSYVQPRTQTAVGGYHRWNERESECFSGAKKYFFQTSSVHWQGRSPKPCYGFQSGAQEGVDTLLGQGDESLEWRHELDEKLRS